MAKQSAGVLVYRHKDSIVEVLIGHQGGPFFAKKDKGAWSIPKGEFPDGEDPTEAAKREFQEEIGQPVPAGEFIELGHTKNKSGKTIYVWAVEGNLDATNITSNTFIMEWPPHSGQQQKFPEIDKAAWVEISKAIDKLNSGQTVFLERLAEKLDLKLEKPEQASLF
jgi:predicted NUDIX family NTP pyrophosphohydrolase